jgi:hypothetical protein
MIFPDPFLDPDPQDCNILNADEQREIASTVPNLLVQEAMERMLEEKEEPRTLVTRETQTSITGTEPPRTLVPYTIISSSVADPHPDH